MGRVENTMFYECEQLEYVELPSSLREIGTDVFVGCNSLRSIKIPQRVERLEGVQFVVV